MRRRGAWLPRTLIGVSPLTSPPDVGPPDSDSEKRHSDRRAYYTAVGNIAVLWSTLERTVELWIWLFCVTADRDAIACLTANMLSVRSKLQSLEGLVILRGAKQTHVKKLRSFMNECEEPAKLRNAYIHQPIKQNEDGDILQFLSTLNLPGKTGKRGLRLELLSYDQKEAIDLIERILVLVERFHVMMLSMWDELMPPSLESIQERIDYIRHATNPAKANT